LPKIIKGNLNEKAGARQKRNGGIPSLWMQQRFHPYSRWFELASLPSITKGQEIEEGKGKGGITKRKEKGK
jgi:hypothetical protein